MERLSKKIFPDFKERPVRVLQFGEGNFLRAFVDWQINELNRKTDFNGSVAVVQPIPDGLTETLSEQDGLYTLYLQGIRDGKPLRDHRVINSIRYAVNPYTDFEAYDRLAQCDTLRFIVSNTTEAGIAYHEGDRLEDRPAVGFPAKLTAFLYRRYQFFGGDPQKGCIILPCELIDRNGEKLRELVLRYAELWNLEPGFIRWLKDSNTFCCTLVDRIVSGYPRDTIDQITKELGYDDRLVDVGEQFHLWVIEGPAEIAEELPVDRAGLNVKFVKDVTPYRTRKVRILNGAHTTLVPVAYLWGLNTVGEAVAHKTVGRFLKEALYEEIIPTLDLPPEELAGFASSVLERFENPYVRHYLMSIALNSVSKYKTRVLPSVLRYTEEKKRLPNRLLFSLAALIEFYKGRRGQETIALNDEESVLSFFQLAWQNCDGSCEALTRLVGETLAREDFWGLNLLSLPGTADLVSRFLCMIEHEGIQAATQRVMG